MLFRSAPVACLHLALNKGSSNTIQFKNFSIIRSTVFISPLLYSQPHFQGLSSYRPLGTRLLCSQLSFICGLHEPVTKFANHDDKARTNDIESREKIRARNVSFTHSLNLVGEFTFCSLQVGNYNPLQTG